MNFNKIKQHITICSDHFASDVPSDKELDDWYEEHGTPYEDNSEAELAARTYNLLKEIIDSTEREYTAIYIDTWVHGSHRNFLTKMRRIERIGKETVAEMLEREEILDDTVFLFHGHPRENDDA